MGHTQTTMLQISQVSSSPAPSVGTLIYFDESLSFATAPFVLHEDVVAASEIALANRQLAAAQKLQSLRPVMTAFANQVAAQLKEVAQATFPKFAAEVTECESHVEIRLNYGLEHDMTETQVIGHREVLGAYRTAVPSGIREAIALEIVG